MENMKIWNGYEPEEQYKKLLAACKNALYMRQEDAKRARVSASELVGDAWIRLDAKIEKDPHKLEELIIFSALDALRAAARFNWHSVGGTVEDAAGAGSGEKPETADGAGLREAWEEDAGTAKRPIETEVVKKISIEEAAADDLDRRIMAAIGAGCTWAQVQKAENLSAGALDRRIKKIRQRWTAAAAEAAKI